MLQNTSDGLESPYIARLPAVDPLYAMMTWWQWSDTDYRCYMWLVG